MSNLKTLATCLPLFYSLIAVLAGLIPDLRISIPLLIVLLGIAAVTPLFFRMRLGRTFMLDDDENTLFNPFTLVVVNLICYGVAKEILPQEWPYVTIAILLTLYLMFDVWLEQTPTPSR